VCLSFQRARHVRRNGRHVPLRNGPLGSGNMLARQAHRDLDTRGPRRGLARGACSLGPGHTNIIPMTDPAVQHENQS
jgi:hypothetical protein